jgi:integrase
MASLIKKPNSRFWWACLRDAHGRQIRRSTGETNEKKAREIARVYEQEAKGKIKPYKFRQVLLDLHREIHGQDLPAATVEQFANDWLNAKKSETKPRTWESYETVIRKFLAFLGDESQIDISLITKTHITGFRASLTEKLSAGTTNNGVRIIKMLFKAARRDGLVETDPTEFVAVVKRDNTQGRRAFTLEEIKAILSVADDEWQSMIRIGFYCGARLGDIARLTWQSVDLQRNQLRFVASKTGRAMLLPIASPLREYILSLPAPDDAAAPLHPRAYRMLQKAHGRVSSLSIQFGDILAAAGLRVPRYDKYHSSQGKHHGRSVRRNHSETSFHSLRHATVSLLKDAHVSEAVAMEFAGHDSKAMSRHYTHTGAKALQEAADLLPGI